MGLTIRYESPHNRTVLVEVERVRDRYRFKWLRTPRTLSQLESTSAVIERIRRSIDERGQLFVLFGNVVGRSA